MTEHDQQPRHVQAVAPIPKPVPPGAPPGGPTGDGPTGDGPTGDGPTGDGPTGDAQIDTALAELENAAPDDLDAQIEAGQRVHRTLQSRLSDLGGQ